MKKLYIALLVASFILPSVSLASIDINLKYGSRGAEVVELQEFLIEKGFLSGQASGNFFSLTRKAVVAYQSSIGLPATGFVGPMTRAKINDDLLSSNASSVSAETTETGTTITHTNISNIATPTQVNSTTLLLVSGCTSTVGFSTITGKPCSTTTTITSTATSKTVTLATGAVVEIDALGNIIKTITPAPLIQSAQTNVYTAVASTEIQISSINITPSINSVKIEWQTDKPTESKVFISGGSLSSRVYNSESGLSTRHMVSTSGLSSGTTYSYEIEAIASTQVSKKQGLFTTKLFVVIPDEYTISLQPDNTSVPVSGLRDNTVYIKVGTLKNGQIQAKQKVSMVTPDSSQNQLNNDWDTTFRYSPRTIGTHKLEFSWNGVSKSIDIQATHYEVAPIIPNVLDNNAVILLGLTGGQTIGSFTILATDEPISISKINLDSTSQNLFRFFNAGGYLLSNSVGNGSNITISPSNYLLSSSGITIRLDNAIEIGKHTVTINSIDAVGNNSGNPRQVSGLPFTFHYEVR